MILFIDRKFLFRIFLLAILLPVLDSCHHTSEPPKNAVSLDKIPISTTAVDSSAYLNSKDYKYYYAKTYTPPPFDFNVDLSNKSLSDLRLLKNEIYARHHYLFMDAILRGYFNQFDWYQPIFWDSTFKFSLSTQENDFINKVNEKYNKLLAENYITKDGKTFANMDNIINLIQFKSVSDTLMQHIRKDGFAIVPQKNMQFFHIYDQNQYDAIPNFVTTDSYLQLLYLHFRNILRSLEQEKFIPALDSMVNNLYRCSMKQAKDGNAGVQQAASFNAAYYAAAYYLLTKKLYPVPASEKVAFDEDLTKLRSLSGDKSALFNDTLFDFTQLQPRGHYTKNDTLKGYFKCLKWLMTTPHFLNSDEKLSAMVLTASNLSKCTCTDGKKLSELYNTIDEPIGFLVGQPDNLSLNDVIKVLSNLDLANKPESEMLSASNLAKMRAKLTSMNPEQIHAHGANDTTQKFLDQVAVYFMPGRYTFDGEILQRLIHVLKPTPMRTFPKGLDVFAALGNQTAQDILLNTYKENVQWPGYKDTLQTLQNKFNGFSGFDNNAYNKTMQLLITLQKPNDSLPYYMQTNAWQRKVLNTSLASWTELKHNTILYIKQPLGAECGEGGGPPPPTYPGYIEPNVAFWKNCLSLLDLISHKLHKHGLDSTGDFIYKTNELRKLDTMYIKLSEKELNGIPLTADDFNRILFIGGEMEGITENLLNTDMPVESLSDPDRYVGLATDVYTYNDKCLEEATGWVNEIYVVVEINGLLYLTRGGVFSYYEFPQPTSDRLTDEQWQDRMEKGELPSDPIWMKDLMAPIKSLGSKSSYTYSANPSSLSGQ